MVRAGLVLLLLGVAAGAAVAADSMNVAVGQVKLRRFTQQVRQVQIRSDNDGIARAWYDDSQGLYVRGEAAGTTDVTITATKVRYQGGTGSPTADETVTERLRVTVGGEVGEPDDGRRVNGPTIVLKVGQSRTAKFNKQTIGVRRPFVSRPEIAQASYANDAVTVKGVRPGWSTMTVTGEFVRYQAGNNVPIQNNRPFSFAYNIHVVPAKPALTLNENITVEVGKKWTSTFGKSIFGVNIKTEDLQVAKGGHLARVFTIEGKKVGATSVVASGKINTWVSQGAGKAKKKITEPFVFTFNVKVIGPRFAGADDVYRKVRADVLRYIDGYEKLPERVRDYIARLGAPTKMPSLADRVPPKKKDVAGLDAEYAKFKAGTITGDAFVTSALDYFYTYGMRGHFQAYLDCTAILVDCVGDAHNLAIKPIIADYEAAYASTESVPRADRDAARSALRAKYVAKEREALDKTIKNYGDVTRTLILARGRCAKEVFAWENYCRQRKWDKLAAAMHELAYQQFCFELNDRPDHGNDSALDFFVVFPGSADRLIISFWKLEGASSLYKMNEALKNAPLDAIYDEAVSARLMPGEPAPTDPVAGAPLTAPAEDTRTAEEIAREDPLIEDPAEIAAAERTWRAGNGGIGGNPGSPNPGASATGKQTKSYSGAAANIPPR
jgi:hypothetical protein